MSAPRTKRQFAGAAADPSQRQITSFFSPRSAAAVPLESNALCQPTLPSSVQSNLLSVGIRVRKSVPEGYKTVSSNGFKMWTDTTIPSSTTKPTTIMGPAPRELLPFCGINRVGGMDTQPEFSLDDDVPPLDCVPELTMSQESMDNDITEPSRKRIFDEDDNDTAPVSIMGLSDGEVSPRSLSQASWGNARRMAVPHSRVRKPVTLKDVDQENMAVDGDFDEADFLVFGEAKQMDTSA